MIIVSQINFLMSLLNDSLDMRLIEEDRFVAKKEKFKPSKVFDFI